MVKKIFSFLKGYGWWVVASFCGFLPWCAILLHPTAWKGRLFGVALALTAGSVGAFLYGVNPEIDVIKHAGKLAQTRSPAVVRRFELAGRGLIILLGVIVAWKLAVPALIDTTNLLVRRAPVQKARCIVEQNQRGLLGLWFLSQSLTISGEACDRQTLYLIYSARFVRPGKEYWLHIAPKSRLVLDVQGVALTQ